MPLEFSTRKPNSKSMDKLMHRWDPAQAEKREKLRISREISAAFAQARIDSKREAAQKEASANTLGVRHEVTASEDITEDIRSLEPSRPSDTPEAVHDLADARYPEKA